MYFYNLGIETQLIKAEILANQRLEATKTLYVKQIQDATNQVTSVAASIFLATNTNFSTVVVGQFEAFGFAFGVFPVLDCVFEVCLFSFFFYTKSSFIGQAHLGLTVYLKLACNMQLPCLSVLDEAVFRHGAPHSKTITWPRKSCKIELVLVHLVDASLDFF